MQKLERVLHELIGSIESHHVGLTKSDEVYKSHNIIRDFTGGAGRLEAIETRIGELIIRRNKMLFGAEPLYSVGPGAPASFANGFGSSFGTPKRHQRHPPV